TWDDDRCWIGKHFLRMFGSSFWFCFDIAFFSSISLY
ncbi:MAG: hypothetical protein ACI90V_006967, partial [Bacillariaceae sp.]